MGQGQGTGNSEGQLCERTTFSRSSSFNDTIETLAAESVPGFGYGLDGSTGPARRSQNPSVRKKPSSCFTRNFLVASVGGRTGEAELAEAYEPVSGDNERELGSGAFGWVQRCYHKPTGQTRAVKRITKEGCQDIEALRHELRIMKVIDHPNLVRLHEVFEDSRYICLCMELCDGGELSLRITRSDRFSEREASLIFRQLVLAVHYLHEQVHIAHRDIKPENIVFAGSVEDPLEECKLKLIDFGMADWCRPGTALTEFAGTPGYVAPEVGAGPYDLRCDVWSVGIVLHELLSGRLPKSPKATCVGPGWQRVSVAAKYLTRSLLKEDPGERLILKSCLDNPWTKGSSVEAGDSTLDEFVVENMQRYAKSIVLRKAALQAISKNLSDQEIRYLHEAFARLDTNGDGVLSLEELRAGVATTSLSRKVDSIFQALDTDGDGELQYTEFLAAALSAQRYLQEDVAWAAFKRFDIRCDGKVTVQGLCNMFRSGESDSMTDEGSQSYTDSQLHKAASALAAADANGDGRITFDEFLAMLRNESPPPPVEEVDRLGDTSMRRPAAASGSAVPLRRPSTLARPSSSARAVPKKRPAAADLRPSHRQKKGKCA